MSSSDRSSFNAGRFQRKLGFWIVISFVPLLMLGLIFLSASLIMNDFIYKPPLLRGILGLYGGLLFIAVIPYYMFLGMTNNQKSPTKYTLLPLFTQDFSFSFLNYFFGSSGWLSMVWTPDISVINNIPGLLKRPSDLDLKPIPITLATLSL